MTTQIAKRPSGWIALWTPERKKIALDHILGEIISGRPIARILGEDEGMPAISTFWGWVNLDAELEKSVANARKLGVEVLLDEAVDIADNSNADVYVGKDIHGEPVARIDGEAIQRSKLRVDTRFKAAAMLNPQKYGDKIDVTSGGEPLPAPAPVVIDARVQTIMMLAAERQRLSQEAQRLLED